MTEHRLFDKPANIFNMVESGIQIINKAGKVLTVKGSKNVSVLTSAEKRESVTVKAYNNAEGRFLPPVLVMKGTNKKKDVCDGLPPGSDVFMNPKSAYINTELFIRWFKEIFLVKNLPGMWHLPLNPHAIPEHMFCIADATPDETQPLSHFSTETQTSTSQTPSKTIDRPSTSTETFTPTKILKGSALELTSPENLERKKSLFREKEQKEKNKIERAKQKAKKGPVERGKTKRIEYDSSCAGPSNAEDSPSSDTNKCAECWENYFTTKKKDDWLKYVKCEQWLHENCKMYSNLDMCNTCGRDDVRQKNLKHLK
ncbi:hypothetical protein ANN_10690 [Periplaneta americana]|uniref:Uncharacterized protein n=1 Tax=Periplaneta americana TaxID=6978 RepID=A0ABQ8T3M9_PERAM|nr:hypothetical protein ANN_10690 [Periplaneta americana]